MLRRLGPCDDNEMNGPTNHRPPAMNADLTRLLSGAADDFADGASFASPENAALIAALSEAFIALDQSLHHEALLRLRQNGVSLTDIVDHLAPAIARSLGERWFADKLSFAHVSIGTARLQEVVKSFNTRQRNRPRQGAATRAVLLIVPRPEEHSLGAVVLANQFWRLGYESDVMVDARPSQVAQRLNGRKYSLIGISAAGPRTLASTKDLIDTIHRSVTHVTPIALGGASLGHGPDALARTGADFIAQDARSALRTCGLPISPAGSEPVADELADRLF